MTYLARMFLAVIAAVVLLAPVNADAKCLSAQGARNMAQGAVMGALGGAGLGALVNRKDRGDGAETGAIVGAVAGAAVGCWTAHEQSVIAAREDALDARTSVLEARAVDLEAYNAELAAKVNTLQSQLAAARSDQYATTRRVNETSGRLVAEQRQARTQLPEVETTLNSVTARMTNLDRGDPAYSQKYAALNRQRIALEGSRAKLNAIITMTA